MLREIPHASLRQPPRSALAIRWLGQAGFVIDGADSSGHPRRVVIDPYLSDSLAEKYRGKTFPHIRMMPPPVAPDGIAHVDLVLATHAHTDHLDPGTLPALMAANPRARLVCPVSCRASALDRAAITPDRLLTIEAGRTIAPDVTITATRAAHESLELDAEGHHRFLGLAIDIGGLRVFHSGDTIPFDGQEAEVAALQADIALFPVNGRDALRQSNGVPGNMTMAEAVALARAAKIPALIVHHFDLFEFNTVPRAEIEQVAAATTGLYVGAARTEISYGWK